MRAAPERRARLLAAILLAAAGLSMTSCRHFEARKAADITVDPAYRDRLERAVFTLREVEAEKGLDSEQVRANAEYILRLVLDRLARERKEPGPSFSVRALIKEEPYVREFRSMNAVTIQLQVYDTDPQVPVARTLYSESTEETVLSCSYLYGILRRAVRQITK